MLFSVPTLNQYSRCFDLLLQVQSGTRVPDGYLVVDNGGGFRAWCERNHLTLPPRTEVLCPGRNIGVAASWNIALRRGAEQTLISNDDVRVEHDTVELTERAAAESPYGLCLPGLGGWCFFLQKQWLHERIGYYDEQFWPAYYEDADYRRRLVVAGLGIARAEHVRFTHSSEGFTRNFDAETRMLIENGAHENRIRYIRKWGGEPRYEQLSTPRMNHAG